MAFLGSLSIEARPSGVRVALELSLDFGIELLDFGIGPFDLPVGPKPALSLS